MQISGKFLALSVIAMTGTAIASAKPLTARQAQAAASRIDSILEKDLKGADLRPNGQIDDGIFVRRAYLGIIGRIPTEQESIAFLDDASSGKRAALVDVIVASPGFDSHLFNWMADLLRIQTNQEQFGLGWHVWLRRSLTEDKPWDAIVREMLSSTGHASKDPAVGYYLRDRNMQLDNFSNTMQVFLGRQIGCAQCHDHPFDDWSQLEYYKMAAFSGGFQYRSVDAQETIRRVATETNPAPEEIKQEGDDKKAREAHREANRKLQQRKAEEMRKVGKLLNPVFGNFNKNALFDDPSRALHLPEDYSYPDAQPKEAVEPETLFGEHVAEVEPAMRREAFAEWVTSPENPYFTKVIANRLWARTFGHGLLDPVNDWSDYSKPAHPDILAFMEDTMKAVDYDLRQFSRVLFLTDLFQRECDPTEPMPGTPHLVRGPALQRMTAEQLYDSLLVLTNGHADDSPFGGNERRWEIYVSSVEKLLASESKHLLVLGKNATEAETKYRAMQDEVRSMRSLMADAENDSERKKLNEKINATQKVANEIRKQADPLAMMSGGMSMMEMSMAMKPAMDDKSSANGKPPASVRASELPAPFNPGTIVREFGGSDRTTPSSGDTIPTVPQALALLNDPTTDIAGKDKRFSLGRSLASLETAGERLDLIYLRLYSRPPSAEEKTRFLPLTEDPVTLRDLTRAMLTSNRFIFIE